MKKVMQKQSNKSLMQVKEIEAYNSYLAAIKASQPEEA
jgi:hypothetical protein